MLNNPSKIFPAFLLLLVALVIPSFHLGDNNFTHHTLVLLCIFSYITCMVTWVSSGCRIISIYNVFILYALFSNLGQAILYLFTDDYLLTNNYYHYNLSHIINCLHFQFQCVAAMNLGTAIYLSNKRHVISNESLISNIKQEYQNKAPRDILYLILIISFIAMSIQCLENLAMRQTMSYDELYEAKVGVGEIPRFIASVLGVYYIFRYPKDKKMNILVYSFWIFFVLCLFIVGRRSMAILFVGVLVLCCPITHPQYFKKKFAWIWVGGLLLFISLISVISAFRQESMAGGGVSSDGFFMNLANSISEFGLSERPLLITMQGVANGTPHYQTIFYTLLHGIFPTDLLSSFGLEDFSLAAWATEYETTYYHSGVGYSFIAEAYMNYGWFGWLFTLVYGWFIAMAENVSYKRIINGKFIIASVLLVILARQIFFARADLRLIQTFYRYGFYLILFCCFIPQLRKKL